MKRLTDPKELHRLIQQNARDEWKPSLEDCERWLAGDNYALVEGDDLGMFSGQGSVEAHVMFASRGKQALETARKMLRHAFDNGATEILGATPAKYRDALMFARLLGFVPYGQEERRDGTVILSKSITIPI